MPTGSTDSVVPDDSYSNAMRVACIACVLNDVSLVVGPTRATICRKCFAVPPCQCAEVGSDAIPFAGFPALVAGFGSAVMVIAVDMEPLLPFEVHGSKSARLRMSLSSPTCYHHNPRWMRSLVRERFQSRPYGQRPEAHGDTLPTPDYDTAEMWPRCPVFGLESLRPTADVRSTSPMSGPEALLRHVGYLFHSDRCCLKSKETLVTDTASLLKLADSKACESLMHLTMSSLRYPAPP